jgi:multicomponent Na+:H+ antiporter subunit B
MSRGRDNYENSAAARCEAGYKGEHDPFDDRLDVHAPEPEKDEEKDVLSSITISDSVYDRHSNKVIKRLGKIYPVFAVLLCMVMIGTLIWMVQFLPDFGVPDNPVNNEVSARYIEKGVEETGAVNFVTGMILDYRAFDTFGESCVLFIATICVQILLRLDPEEKNPDNVRRRKEAATDRLLEPKNDIILQKVSVVLVPLLFIFGIYIILNGHLSPGGGFSGGAVIGAGLILYLCAFGYEKTEKFFTIKTFRIISLAALITYCLAKSYSFYTGANHLESHIPLGTPGNILSSGLILVLNICVGSVVSCTMYAFYTLFRKGDF